MADVHFRTIHQIVKAARLRLNQTHWDYLIGATETETTLKRNRMSIDSLALKPRVLRDVSNVDTSGEFLGHKLTIPVCLAPIGSLQVFEAGGGATAAKAAAEFGCMVMSSSVCTPALEDIAAAADGPKIFQLYVRGDADWTDEMVQRAIDAGFTAFCLTVDTATVSRRERDIAKGVVPTSTAFMQNQRDPSGNLNFQAMLNWNDVKRIRDKFDIPLILKGINTGEDAAIAVDHGIDVIYVSNHGGRQLDQGRGTIELLKECLAEVNGRAKIAVDGGFYRGTDILKAIARGADIVGIGRLEAWAMAAGGQPAVVRMLEILRNEMLLGMALPGVPSLDELDASFLAESQPVVPPSVISAFPLLNVDDEGY